MNVMLGVCMHDSNIPNTIPMFFKPAEFVLWQKPTGWGGGKYIINKNQINT